MSRPRVPSALAPLVAAVALAPLLGGCLATSDTLPGLAVADAAAPSLARSIGPERALVALPREAGAVVSVVERTTAEGLTQTVTLAADPGARTDDRIEITARRHGGALPRLDEETVTAEMDEALPGVALRVSPRVVVAGTGPLGIATGRGTDGTACLYAWSQGTIADRGGAPTLFTARETTALSLRLRLCRRGVSEEQLIALAEGLTLRRDLLAASATDAPPPRIGRDALESAGYAPAPRTSTTTTTAAPTRTGSIAAPQTRATAAAPSARPSPAYPADPAGLVAPIPLPTGG